MLVITLHISVQFRENGQRTIETLSPIYADDDDEERSQRQNMNYF